MENKGFSEDICREETRERLRLPFEKRRSDWGAWAYDHKAGIFVTVIVYLLLAIAFVSARIVIRKELPPQGFLIELEAVPEEKQPESEPDEAVQRELSPEDFRDVRNLSSNENARLDAGLKDAKGTQAGEIYDEANALQERLNASRAHYEQGLSEAEAILKNRNETRQGTDERPEDVRVKGKVTVSYSLEGRQAVYLPVPAYRCEGGGEVTVNITVNRNGAVTNTAAARGSSNDPCLLETALQYAAMSRFNVDGTAPDRQTGTITYVFIPQ